jgi:hypothetical protein
MRKAYGALLDLRERRSVYETVLDRYGERLPGAEGLSDMVHRKLGREALSAAGRVYGLGRSEQAYVDELLAFAVDCSPDVSGQPLYRTMQSRKLIGPRGMYYLLDHKGRWWLRRRSWKYRGY